MSNVTIIVEWEQESGVSYNVSVIPNPLAFRFYGNTSQLTVPYNTTYSVTVVATLCGRSRNVVTTDIDITADYLGELYYAMYTFGYLYHFDVPMVSHCCCRLLLTMIPKTV